MSTVDGVVDSQGSPPSLSWIPTSPGSSESTTFEQNAQYPEKQCDYSRNCDSGATLVDQSPRDLESGIANPNGRSFLKRLTGALTGASNEEKQVVQLDAQSIDYHPIGYPRLAAWINSDENFLVARRYGFLHSRVMLYRQSELHSMEMKLLELDEADAEEPNARFLRCRALDNNRDEPERAELINKIDKKLQEYDDIVLRHRKMASLPKATTRNYNSLANWMLKWKPLASKEAKFIERDQDFVALVDEKEGSWFDALIEDFLGHLHRPLARSIFSDHAQRISSEDDDLDLYSKSRIDIFARIIITLLAVVLLMAPVVVLFRQEESGAVKIAVILLFTLVFSAALAVFTKAKRHEVFSATAA